MEDVRIRFFRDNKGMEKLLNRQAQRFAGSSAIAISMLLSVGFDLDLSSGLNHYRLTQGQTVSQSAMAQETPDQDAEADDLTPAPKGGKSEQPVKKPAAPKEVKQLKPQFIDTSIEEKSEVTQPAAPEARSDEYVEREAKLAEPLKKLVQAPFVFNNAKGGSNELTEAFIAATKAGPKLKDDLQFILENGSPAGKLYAACLIRGFDGATGTRLLTGFKADKTLVKNKSYISQEHYTVGEVATDLLSPAPTILLRPR